MSTQSIITWVVGVTSSLLPSRSQTLARIVAAAVHLGRLNLAQLGRRLAGPIAAEHKIKQVWRFTATDRIEISDAMAGLIDRLVRKRKKRLIIRAGHGHNSR